MKVFIYIFVLIFLGCSYSVPKSDADDGISTCKNLILFLREYDRFDIYYKSDTLSFYLEKNNNEDNEYIYEIYSTKDKVKCGRFVYSIDFENSDTLNLYFNCTSTSLPKEICNQWFYFVKDSQPNLYYKK